MFVYINLKQRLPLYHIARCFLHVKFIVCILLYFIHLYSNLLISVATKYADHTQAAKHKLHLWKYLPALACRNTSEYSSFTRDWQILVGVVQQIATYFSFLTSSYPLAQNCHKPICWKKLPQLLRDFDKTPINQMVNALGNNESVLFGNVNLANRENLQLFIYSNNYCGGHALTIMVLSLWSHPHCGINVYVTPTFHISDMCICYRVLFSLHWFLCVKYPVILTVCLL